MIAPSYDDRWSHAGFRASMPVRAIQGSELGLRAVYKLRFGRFHEAGYFGSRRHGCPGTSLTPYLPGSRACGRFSIMSTRGRLRAARFSAGSQRWPCAQRRPVSQGHVRLLQRGSNRAHARQARAESAPPVARSGVASARAKPIARLFVRSASATPERSRQVASSSALNIAKEGQAFAPFSAGKRA